MDLKELVTFRTIVQEGTFSRAASKLNYAQSTVTSQVKRLEQELGLQLFKRGWDAELTEAGRRYADEVDSLIAHWHYAAEQAKALRQEEIGELRIGLIESLADDVMPAAMQAFSKLKPKLTIHFTIGNTDALAREIHGQTIQAAICGQPDAVEGLRFQPLYSERASFIAAADHPLAAAFGRGGDVPISALFDYPVILGGKTCLYHLHVQRALTRIGTLPLVHTVSRITSIPAMVRSLPAVGVVLESTPLPADVVRLPVQLESVDIPVGILLPKTADYMPMSLDLLLQCLRDGIARRGSTTGDKT